MDISCMFMKVNLNKHYARVSATLLLVPVKKTLNHNTPTFIHKQVGTYAQAKCYVHFVPIVVTWVPSMKIM